MAKEHVKQHFIPRCYLRNFSENGKFVFVYSKKNIKKVYSQSISKTACQDYFYTIPKKYIKEELSPFIDSDIIEKTILANHIEGLYSSLIAKIIQAESGWANGKETIEILNPKEKDLFSALIAVQYLRMPNIRDLYWNAAKKGQNQRNELISAAKKAYGDIDCSEALALDREDDFAAVLHAEIFLDDKLIADIQDHLRKKVWEFKVAINDSVFTSDNPILLEHNNKITPAFHYGFAMKGIEIIFPVSKNIILTIRDKKALLDSKADDDKFSLLVDKELRRYNCYQYIVANNEIYSSENNFKLIELLKTANGNMDKEITIKQQSIKVNGK